MGQGVREWGRCTGEWGEGEGKRAGAGESGERGGRRGIKNKIMGRADERMV